MIKEVKNESEFKTLCQNAWNDNSNLWINNRKLPSQLKLFLLDFLFEKDNPSIIDIGCGNGWLFQEILDDKFKLQFSYLGIDMNHYFINHLNSVNTDQRGAFIVADFEKNINLAQNKSIDKAVAILSLIEMSNLKMVFSNIFEMLRNDAKCMIVVLNPYFEMIRLNSNMEDLSKDIASYREGKLFYYEKEIISNGKKSESNYYGLLHPISKYISTAKEVGLKINDFKEIDAIDELGTKSTIYHCIEFIKL